MADGGSGIAADTPREAAMRDLASCVAVGGMVYTFSGNDCLLIGFKMGSRHKQGWF